MNQKKSILMDEVSLTPLHEAACDGDYDILLSLLTENNKNNNNDDL